MLGPGAGRVSRWEPQLDLHLQGRVGSEALWASCKFESRSKVEKPSLSNCPVPQWDGAEDSCSHCQDLSEEAKVPVLLLSRVPLSPGPTVSLLIFPLPSPPPILTPQAQLHLWPSSAKAPSPIPVGFLGPALYFCTFQVLPPLVY